MVLEASKPRIWQRRLDRGRRLHYERFAYLAMGTVVGGLVLFAISNLLVGDFSGLFWWLGAAAVVGGSAYYLSRRVIDGKCTQIVILVTRTEAVAEVIDSFVRADDHEKMRWYLRNTGTDGLDIYFPQKK